MLYLCTLVHERGRHDELVLQACEVAMETNGQELWHDHCGCIGPLGSVTESRRSQCKMWRRSVLDPVMRTAYFYLLSVIRQGRLSNACRGILVVKYQVFCIPIPFPCSPSPYSTHIKDSQPLPFVTRPSLEVLMGSNIRYAFHVKRGENQKWIPNACVGK